MHLVRKRIVLNAHLPSKIPTGETWPGQLVDLKMAMSSLDGVYHKKRHGISTALQVGLDGKANICTVVGVSRSEVPIDMVAGI